VKIAGIKIMKRNTHYQVRSFRRGRGAVAAIALVTVPLLALSGCTSSGKVNSASPSASNTVNEASSALSKSVDTTLSSEPVLPKSGATSASSPVPAVVNIQPGTATDGFEGARSDVSNLKCALSDGIWKTNGKITNSTDHPVDYRIYVSYLRGNETAGLIEVDVAGIKSGKSEDWKAELPIVGNDVDCVLRVERVKARS
jgi:outer membrane murein-binding lipoprotein Lpp